MSSSLQTPWAQVPAGHRWVIWLALLPVALLTALTTWAMVDDGDALPALDITLAVCAVGAVPLLWTRYQVATAYALAALAAVGPPATTSATLAALAVARSRSPHVAIPVALAGVAGHLVQGLWRPIPLPYGWWVLCVAAVYAALVGWGEWARTRAELVRSLWERAERAEREQAERVRRAKDDERARIAREMHDSLAHHLTVIAATAGALEYRPDAPPAQAAAAAGRVRTLAGDALVELRTILRVLRADDGDLRPAPGLAQLDDLVAAARTGGASVVWTQQVDGDPPDAVALAVYRVLQEALTNARRHAPGAAVEAALTIEPGQARLSVADDGRVRAGRPAGELGELGELGEGAGTGLVGLTERVELLGGTLEAGRRPEGGFAVVASIPWQSCPRPSGSR